MDINYFPEAFRDSEFIDFNFGLVKIEPMKLLKTLNEPLQLTEKIRFFNCRVDVWTLGVAVEMLKEMETHKHPSVWRHAAYGLVSVVFCYFEMIGKILNPDSKEKYTSGTDFNFGFCDVYPEYNDQSDSHSDEDMPEVKEFRNRIRNGIYHLGSTKKGLWIHNSPQEFGKDFEKRPCKDGANDSFVYFVNPHSMTRTIVNHFPGFVERLNDSDPKYDPMRKKFRKFFDDFHAV